MGIYTVIFISISLLTILEETVSPQKRQPLVFVMFFILFTASALHGIGGEDFEIYQYVYNKTPVIGNFLDSPYSYQEQLHNWGIGYLLIISALKTVGLTYTGYIVLQSAVFYLLMYKGLKPYTKHWGILLLVFIYKMFIYCTFVSLKQSITIVVFFCIMKYIYEGKVYNYFFWCTILIFIHAGAAILFPIYFISKIKLTRFRLIIWSLLFLPTILLARLGFATTVNTIMMFIDRTKGEAYTMSGELLNIIYAFEYYLLMTIVIINFQRLKNLEHGVFIIKIFTLILPIVTLFSGIAILRRELDYFFFAYGIIGGYLCDILPKLKALIIASYMAICYYGFYRYLHNFDDGQSIPYRTWFQTVKE